jgi:ABC-2 type transport system ATP-binding protein
MKQYLHGSISWQTEKMVATTVRIRNLTKSFGSTPAVQNLSFDLHPGELLGLIGPNGAGKSSTIKMMLDFFRPDSGSIHMFNEPMNESAKDRIGYLPEEKGLYRKLPAFDQIIYLAALKGVGKTDASARAIELLEQTGMLEHKNMKIKHMSKGMGQIIQFIVTIIHSPDLVILDEPFSGLDPVNADMMKRQISALRSEGKAVILSTHQMNQVEELCDRVLMIDHGREVLSGSIEEVKAEHRRHSVLIDVEGELGNIEGVAEKIDRKEVTELVLDVGVSPQSVLDDLRGRGIFINRFEIATPSLNDIFLAVAGGSHE